MNVSKSTKKPVFLFLLGVALVGIPLTIFALQQQQIFKQFAWSTQQSASSSCSATNGQAIITVSFTNTESTKDMDVVAKDLQTGITIDLGTVKHQDTHSGEIATDKTSLDKGGVLFTLTWADGTSGTDTRTATYDAVDTCPQPTPTPDNFCPAGSSDNQGLCKWDPLGGALGYDVTVKETQSGNIIKQESVSKDATESAFPMTPGVSYQCTVTATNACGKGTPAQGPEKVCSAPTPTPTPNLCPSDSPPLGFCRWDAVDGAAQYNVVVKNTKSGDIVKSGTVNTPDTEFAFPDNPDQTYECSVTAVNQCTQTPPTKSPPSTCNVPTPSPSVTPTNTPTPSPTPTPTPKPSPTPTMTPTPTPKPQPTPTPVVIVRLVTSPPQQIVVQQPPQQTVIRQPGTQTVIQQPGPQTVVQQPAPQTVLQQPNQPARQTTPVPTVMPTGSGTTTMLMVGASTILLLAGGLIFFIL